MCRCRGASRSRWTRARVIPPSRSTAAPGPTTTTDPVTGQAVFTVSDATAEPVSYTATDTTDAVMVTQTATVTFGAPVVSPTTSSMTAASSSVPEAGSTTITVSLKDQGVNPQPVVGKVVSLSQGTGSSVISAASTGSDTTNAQGQATFTVSDPTSETVVYSATDTTDGIALTGLSASVTFGTLVVSATDSTVTTTTPIVATVASSGPTPTGIVTVTLLGGSSPVAGKSVTLHASSQTVVISPDSVVSGADGRASFTVSDPTAETVTFNAVDSTDNNLAIVATTQVAFDAPTASPTTSTETVSPTTVVADGITAASVTVKIEDQFGTSTSRQDGDRGWERHRHVDSFDHDQSGSVGVLGWRCHHDDERWRPDHVQRV